MNFAAKIGLSAAAAALLTAPLLGAAVFFEARDALQERIVHEQFRQAQGVMREIDAALQQASTDVGVIAADELLRGYMEDPGTGDKDMLAEELEARGSLTGPWVALAVFDVAGHAVFAPKPLGKARDIAAYPISLPAFERALKGEFQYPDRVLDGGAGRSVVICAAPIRGRGDAQRVVGVVLAQYDLASVQHILDHVELPAIVHLIDRDRRVIGVRGDDREVRPLLPAIDGLAVAGERGRYAIRPRSLHGAGEMLAVEVEQGGFENYRGSGWRLVLEQPLDKVFAPIAGMARDAALRVAAALLLLAAVFGVLGRRFVAPLASLVRGVRRVAEGEFTERLEVRGNDEFAALAQDFNIMLDRLQQRTRQLAQAQEELVRQERLAMLGQVAGSIGHELRNPLGVMSNAVYFLKTVLSGADETTKEYLGIIEREIAGAERIVADLLDSVRTKPPQPEAVGVAALVDQVLTKCAVPATVTVSVDVAPELVWRADPHQMAQVLRNLISNACEATPAGGALEIRASEDAAEKTVTVSVRDSGTGIAPEQMARLFQPLFTTKARGIGLGLVMVKKLTEVNGGKVTVTSEPGHGAEFTLTLPAVESKE